MVLGSLNQDFCCLLSICAVVSIFAAAPLSAQMLLEGRVEHSPKLSPVDDYWKIGAKFEKKRLPAPDQGLTWWKVPSWLAGSWKTEGKVRRLSLKEIGGERSQGFDAIDINYPDIEVIGYQKDAEAAVWTCVPTPYIGRTVQGKNMNVSVIYSADPLTVSEKEVVIKFLARTIVVNKKDNKIVSVTQRESLQTYRPIEDGKVLVQASMRFFDENGEARYESKVLSHERRKDSYKETPYLPSPAKEPTLIDLRRSFAAYLKRKNLKYLIPETEPLPALPGYKIIVI